MNTLWAHWKLLRPLNLTTGAFAVWVSSKIISQAVAFPLLLITMGVVVCYNAGANALNDYWDYDIDRVNRPNRPLSTGLVSRTGALWLGIGLFVVGTLLALKLPWLAFFLSAVVALPLMVFYTPAFKGRPLIGNVVVAFSLGLTFLFSGAAFSDMTSLYIPAALAFGLTLIRELVKDMADLEGDRKVGLNTFPIMAGLRSSGRLVAVLSGLVILGALGPIIAGVYGWGYTLVVIPGVILPLGYLLIRMLRYPTIPEAVRGARLLKGSTIAGVLAIYLGAVI